MCMIDAITVSFKQLATELFNFSDYHFSKQKHLSHLCVTDNV